MKAPVPKVLEKYVLHATSWRGYWSIINSGEIRPNEGQFPVSYYSSYHCKEITGVSLLHMPSLADAYRSGKEVDSDWLQVLRFHKPFTIIAAMRPECIQSNLRWPDACIQNLGSAQRPFIAPGEVCHIGPISTSMIERVFVSLDYMSIFDVTDGRFSKQDVVDAANHLRSKERSSQPQVSALSTFYIPGDDFLPQISLEKLENESKKRA